VTVSVAAFARLRELLSGVNPALPPIPLHIGEVTCAAGYERVSADHSGWWHYPTLGGTAELRDAYARYLLRRFNIEPGERVAFEATPGSKQAVSAAIALSVSRLSVSRPGRAAVSVALPNPFYPSYLAATQIFGACPVFYGAGTDISRAVDGAETPVAAIVVCQPGVPCGTAMSATEFRQISALAARHDALLIVDECYLDFYIDDAIVSYLDVTCRPRCQYVVLHTLSKRSAAPGLRSGFMAGDPASVARYVEFNRSCGVSGSDATAAIAAALWDDDERVEALRQAVRRNSRAADEVLAGLVGYRSLRKGVFLWIPVRDDISVARSLWADCGVSVMPGSFLGCETRDGNPGSNHVRISLAGDESATAEALQRVRTYLSHEGVAVG